MKAPQRPPAHVSLNRLLPNAQTPEVAKFLADANRDYWSWEEVRRHPRPSGFSAEEMWSLVHVSRWPSSRAMSLVDAAGRPFTYCMLGSAHERLHRFDRDAGALLSGKDGSPAAMGTIRDRVLISSLMEESISTAMIEGAVTTRRVAKEMLRNDRTPRTKSEWMVLNGYRTMTWLREQTARDLDESFLLEIQASMTQGTLDDEKVGRFRAAGEHIHVVDCESGEVVHEPPPAEALPERLRRLFAFAREKNDGVEFVHPLVKAAILHFWIAYEHPFVDGNGRTARAVLNWWLLKCGFELIEFLSISRVILAAPTRYYRAFLYSETYGNDLTYSILNIVDAASRAVGELKKYLQRKLTELREVDAAMQRDAALNQRQHALLAHAIRHPDASFTFESHRNSHAISYLTARKDFLALVERRLFSIERKGRKMFFRPTRLLAKRLRID